MGVQALHIHSPVSKRLPLKQRFNLPSTNVMQLCGSFTEFVLSDHKKISALRAAYLVAIEKSGTWGSEIEGRHLTAVFPICICFWAKDHQGKYQRINQYGQSGRILHILFSDNHLEAIKIDPVEKDKINPTDIQTNSGGGDCLYRAFHQAYHRCSKEPENEEIDSYRHYVSISIQRDTNLDFEGILTHLMLDFQDWGSAIGAGQAINDLLSDYWQKYQLPSAVILGGGSVPPKGFLQDSSRKIGIRDVVQRNRLSRADRMIDRIGRLVATKSSVHVAVALDGKVLVMSCNADTDNVRVAISNLVDYYGKRTGVKSDPMQGVTGQERVKSGVTGVTIKRRDKDKQKMAYLTSEKLMKISVGEDAQKLQLIKDALSAGLYLNNAERRYQDQEPGIYLIPHYDGREGTVHGEMNVTNVIKKRRIGQNLTDNVYIGGTLVDCYDCNRAHKASNQYLGLQGENWLFYSGGTHGNSFPGWYLTPDIRGYIDENTFKQQRFDGNLHKNIEQNQTYWDTYDARFVECYGYYHYSRRGKYTHTDWFALPKTQRVSVDVTKTADAWLGEEGEQYFKRKKAIQPNRTPHSFGDDSDSETDDYEVIFEERKQQKEKFDKRDELFISPKISKAKKILQLYPNTVDLGLFKKPDLPISKTSAVPLALTSQQLVALPKNKLSLIQLKLTVKQNLSFDFLMPLPLVQLLSSLKRDSSPTLLFDPFVLRAVIQIMQSSIGIDSSMNLSARRSTSTLRGEEVNQLIKVRLGTRAYLTMVRAVLLNLFIDADPSRLGAQHRLTNQTQSLQVSRMDGPERICLALIFDQFMALLDMTEQRIDLSGSLNDCLQLLAIAKLIGMQQASTGEMQSAISDPESFTRFWDIYRALAEVFMLTGIGEWSLNALLDFVDDQKI
jgi:hypothetical protein